MSNLKHEWWRGAVIYQIYPRSFMDSNADGIGDLAGITNKLDYIADLGVDAIWVSPFFKSPMLDFGYDVSDYRDIDPMFGDLDDFDQLLEKAHQLNLKVMIDQVVSHTSDQHAWFQESRQSHNNDKADWYVWADPKEDGTPPNNWLSVFGGSAWQWDTRRKQYYLHNFLSSQPDLNFHHPEVRQQVLDDIEFWIKRGVDGFRLDAITACFHDPELRDNPPKPPSERTSDVPEVSPFAYQYRYYNNDRPEIISFFQDLRKLLDQYPGVTTLGEVAGENVLDIMARYTEGNDKLHSVYNFELLSDHFSAAYIRDRVETLEAKMTEGWPCWSVGNHDVQRVMTRWGGEDASPALAKMLIGLLATLRGSICIYQGEELGLTQADISYEQMQDPYGIAFWPEFKGRDGCRTPMPWSKTAKNASFSNATDPWLPIPDEHLPSAVSEQIEQTDSVLAIYRQFLQWRRQWPALIRGDIEFIDAPKHVLLFVRQQGESKILVCINCSEHTVNVPIHQLTLELLDGHGFSGAALHDNSISLPSYGACFAQVRKIK